MLAFVLVTALHDAISRAQTHLLSLQAPDGHWIGELEADWALTDLAKQEAALSKNAQTG